MADVVISRKKHEILLDNNYRFQRRKMNVSHRLGKDKQFPLAEMTGRVDGPSSRLVETGLQCVGY